jgi:hypothetical protein
MLEQLAAGRDDFEAEVLRPVLARLFTRLAAAEPAATPVGSALR